MKILFFLILFLGINILSFGANVYFLNAGSGYIYTNGQNFNSTQDGRAFISYKIWADPTRYTIDEWGAKFQDPDGSWSDWSQLSTSIGHHKCLKAGTWNVKGRVHVVVDRTTYQTDFFMETSFTLYAYVLDNYAPAVPASFSGSVTSGHPSISWSANAEDDLEGYVIDRWEGSWENGVSTITSTSFTDYDVDIDPMF
ncbi:MAG: hypothetical protein JEY94_10540 [Melioribacteraceae bacterium]|nr:hypothetical protein [Melioribacteraceae bacterium]